MPVRPYRPCFGKYVPVKNGRLSADITTVMGQPPRLFIACVIDM